MFTRLFAGREDAAPTLAEVRNITVGRTVSLDPLAWRRLGDETCFTLDRDALEITAQGRITLEGGQFVHRFYTDDHVMLQAMSDDAEGQATYDFSLFIPWTSAYPPGDREVARPPLGARLRRPGGRSARLPALLVQRERSAPAARDPLGRCLREPYGP
jgi:hypothetical protein